jgi:hypothetical protein
VDLTGDLLDDRQANPGGMSLQDSFAGDYAKTPSMSHYRFVRNRACFVLIPLQVSLFSP